MNMFFISWLKYSKIDYSCPDFAQTVSRNCVLYFGSSKMLGKAARIDQKYSLGGTALPSADAQRFEKRLKHLLFTSLYYLICLS